MAENTVISTKFNKLKTEFSSRQKVMLTLIFAATGYDTNSWQAMTELVNLIICFVGREFFTKNDCENLIRKKKVGSFLMLFSEEKIVSLIEFMETVNLEIIQSIYNGTGFLTI